MIQRTFPLLSFTAEMRGVIYWLRAAKAERSPSEARYCMTVALTGISRALSVANGMGDAGAKRLAFVALNKARAQFNAAAF